MANTNGQRESTSEKMESIKGEIMEIYRKYAEKNGLTEQDGMEILLSGIVCGQWREVLLVRFGNCSR